MDKIALLAMLAALAEKGGGMSMEVRAETRRADPPKFETETEALVYAEKLAKLKPGDRVEMMEVGKEPKKGVFFARIEEGKCAAVLYWDGDKELCLCSFPWGELRVPS